MQTIQELLATVPPGPVLESIKLDKALAACWDDLSGSNEGGMKDRKLLNGRMKNVRWQSPILSFTIARHGAAKFGSTRDELQHWEVNLDDCTACIVKEGYRQREPMARRVSIIGDAEEITHRIISGQDDERIRRLEDGSVNVLASEIFPTGSGFKRTIEGRRKRLLGYVGKTLGGHGWKALGGSRFGPPGCTE